MDGKLLSTFRSINRKKADYGKYLDSIELAEKDIKTNNEFYICPVYNEAIGDQKLIISHKVKAMHGMGTPNDLEAFMQKDIIK